MSSSRKGAAIPARRRGRLTTTSSNAGISRPAARTERPKAGALLILVRFGVLVLVVLFIAASS